MKSRGVPSGYVEGLNDARTPLADFFNSLLRMGWLRAGQVVDGQEADEREPLSFNLAPTILFLPIYDHQGMHYS